MQKKLDMAGKSSTTPEARFALKYQLPSNNNDCWVWTGCRNHRGYGQFYFRGRARVSHRVAWILNFGEIPEGMSICHHCDNPPCVNPDHLFLGTMADNMSDKMTKGRLAKGPTSGAHTHPDRVSRGTKHSSVMKVAAARGEKQHMAKLTSELVLEIRKLLETSGLSQREIAEQYDVTKGTISAIHVRKNWKHI